MPVGSRIVGEDRSTNSNGMSSWNRSDIELTKIVFGFRQLQRHIETFGPKAEIKALLVGMARDAAPALRKDLRVAVRAAGAHL